MQIETFLWKHYESWKVFYPLLVYVSICCALAFCALMLRKSCAFIACISLISFLL